MKTKTKALTMALCAMLLVAASVLTTVAFLTSHDSVKNTFTVGKVALTLDEAEVDEYGTVTPDKNRVKANEYKLIPGHEYTKDPTVHFAAGSEASYLFVKVENGIQEIEAADKTVEKQILGNGWQALEGQSGVYYKKVAANNGATAIDYKVFEAFTLSDDAAVEAFKNAEINITAYAVQADGFDTAALAWAEISK